LILLITYYSINVDSKTATLVDLFGVIMSTSQSDLTPFIPSDKTPGNLLCLIKHLS